VAANLMASRLTILYGPSGVGKSSLVRAGVVRRLRSLVPATGGDGAETEVVIVDSWRDDPIAAVVVAAHAPAGIPLADALAERAAAAGGELYVVLDQMEEYFLYHGRDGGPLADVLEDVLTRSDFPVHVLLGIRDDALADLDALKRRVPGVFGNVLRLDHLTRVAARAAVHGPLQAYAELGGPEVTAEEELVEAVLDEVAAGSIQRHLSGRGIVDEDRSERRVEAPFLQLVLERLWEVERRRGSVTLRAATLTELGGAGRIVEEHLGHALAGLDDAERDLVARLFNHLVTPSGTKIAHAVDDLARYGGVDPASVGPVLGALEAARILRRVPGRSGGPPRYEIFHDVLAQAVLAWRDRHESDRALEVERARARRRHRRLGVVTVLALVALAGTLALAAWALSQRAEAREQRAEAREQTHAAESAARSARTRRLEASAIVELGRDPELSLLLAREAAQLVPTSATEDVLRRTLRESRVRTVTNLGVPVTDLAVVGVGRLAAVTRDGAVRMIVRGRSGRVVVPPAARTRSWLSFGRALTLRGGTMVVRSLPGGSRIASFRVPADTRFAASGPEGRRFVVAGRRSATVVDADGAVLATLAHPALVQRASFSPNGLLIATAGADGNAMVWDQFGTLLRTFQGADDSRMFDVSFSPLSRILVAASSDGTARTWIVPTSLPISIMALHGNHVLRASFGGNEDSVLTASRDRTARTWKVETGGPRAVFVGHTDTVTAAVFTPGDMLATASHDQTVRTWVAQLQPHLRPAPSLRAPTPTIHPRATVQGADVTLQLDGRTVELVGHEDDVLSVEVSRDGSRVVTASSDADARIWDAQTGETLHVLRGHAATVFDASFSPNGRWVVTAGPTTAGLWDARTGERVYFLQGHEGGHLRAAEFRGSDQIVTSGADGVRRFLCDTCGGLTDLLRLAERRLAATERAFTEAERRLYLRG
jgi:WD40 repeat protein